MALGFRSALVASRESSNATRNQRRRTVTDVSHFWKALTAGSLATPMSPAGAAAGGGSSSSLTSTPTTSQPATSFRAAKEAQAVLAITQNEKTNLLNRPRSLALTNTVEIGQTKLSETEKWKLQAAMRREEQKASGEKYNQAMLRETKVCKGPTPNEAFPAGRGRPVEVK